MKRYIFLVFLILILCCSIVSADSITTPDGSKEYITDRTGTLQILNTTTNTMSYLDLASGDPNSDRAASLWGITITPDGSKVYVTSITSTGFVYVIDTKTDSKISTISIGAMCPLLIFMSPDGKKVYVSNIDDVCLSVIDTTADTLITNVYMSYHPFGMVISPDSSRVYVINAYPYPGCITNIAAIDTTTYTIIKRYYFTDNVGNFTSISLNENMLSGDNYNIDVSDTLYPSSTNVPEFPTIAAPLAILLGLMVVFRKKD